MSKSNFYIFYCIFGFPIIFVCLLQYIIRRFCRKITRYLLLIGEINCNFMSKSNFYIFYYISMDCYEIVMNCEINGSLLFHSVLLRYTCFCLWCLYESYNCFVNLSLWIVYCFLISFVNILFLLWLNLCLIGIDPLTMYFSDCSSDISDDWYFV